MTDPKVLIEHLAHMAEVFESPKKINTYTRMEMAKVCRDSIKLLRPSKVLVELHIGESIVMVPSDYDVDELVRRVQKGACMAGGK